MKAWSVTITSDEPCRHCGCTVNKDSNWLEYIVNPLNLLDTCPICYKQLSDPAETDGGLTPLKAGFKTYRYESIFMETYDTITRNIGALYDSELLTAPEKFIEPNYGSNHPAAFSDNDYYAIAIVDIYTAFELFIRTIVMRRIEKFIANKKQIDLSLQQLSSKIYEIVKRINNGDKQLISHLENGEYKLKITDYIELLPILGIKSEEFSGIYYSFIRDTRVNILHKGQRTATFDDFVESFDMVGRLFIEYNKLILK